MTRRLESHAFDNLASQRAVLLTTYKKDGTPVDTAVNIAVEGDRAFFRTWDKSWKARRLKRNQLVHVAPSTMSGQQTGPKVQATARLLEGEASRHAAELIERKHRLLQGVMVPFFHRLKRYKTLHFELTPSS